MTTTNGTYQFCDSDLSFSVTFTCTGPSCTSLLGHNNLNCTQTSSQSWNCTNGVTCKSSAGFTSTFSIGQPNTNMSQNHTQNVTLHGNSFIFQQDAEGNVKLSNGTSTAASTASSTATASSTSAAASTSSSTSGSSSHKSLPILMLCAMLLLSIFATSVQAQVTATSIGNAVDAIFQNLDKTGDGKSLYEIGASGMAKEFNDIVVKTCSTFVGQGATNMSVSGLALAFGQCEEAMFSAEMSLIGGSLNFTSYNKYTGLGGTQATALTPADDTTVQNADKGAIPELFLANSALCGLLVAAIQQMVLNPSSENLCSALESAATRHEAGPTSTTSSASSTTATTSITSQTASTTSSSSSSSSSPTATPTISAGTLPANFATNKCLDCFLNTYLDSLVELSAETCNNIPAVSASAYDLSSFFCDPSIVPSTTPGAAAFCASLCAKPCATFNVQGIIQGLGSSYVANPAVNVDQLGALCNVCGPQGAQSVPNPEQYRCPAPVPNCLCGIGSQLCVTQCD